MSGKARNTFPSNPRRSMHRFLSLSIVLSLAAVPAVAAQDSDMTVADVVSWQVDRAHSSVDFSVRHFFTPVNGTFSDYDIELQFDPDNLDGSSMDVTIDVASVNTRNERRDNDLRSDSFFEVETWPTITFVSERIESTGEDQYVAHGQLTMRDVTRDFALPFTLLGVMEFDEQRAAQMRRSAVAGFTAEASLNRLDYGVGSGNWTSTAVVGNEVDVSISIEAAQPAEQ